jgi:hypothetical protein
VSDNPRFRLQSFHYEVAQAVRIALVFLGKLDNELGHCHGQRVFPIGKLQRAQRPSNASIKIFTSSGVKA